MRFEVERVIDGERFIDLHYSIADFKHESEKIRRRVRMALKRLQAGRPFWLESHREATRKHTLSVLYACGFAEFTLDGPRITPAGREYVTAKAPRRVWTAERRAILSRNYGHMPNAALAERLGVPIHVLHNQAYKEGLTRVAMQRVWLDCETQFLRDNLLALGVSGVAKALGRSYRSVNNRAHRLGIMPKAERRGGLRKLWKPMRTSVVTSGAERY